MDFSLEMKERSFGGKKFRPTPVTFLERDSNLFISITPWGREDIGESVVESIRNFISLATEDTEVTVPYARKDTLNQMGNVLRMAVIMASEMVYRKHNEVEYSSGFEIFAGVMEGQNFTYVCVGQPSFLLLRDNVGPLPVHHGMDLNVKVSNDMLTEPLPNEVLGMGQHPPIQFGNIKLYSGDKLLLVSRSYLPNNLFRLERRHWDIDTISHILAKDNVNVPFWLGLVEVD